jgi:hypothetical protein
VPGYVRTLTMAGCAEAGISLRPCSCVVVATDIDSRPSDILTMPRVELAAVNQCSRNSRGLFKPRVPGGEWFNGAMGSAKGTGVRLRDIPDRAGFKAGAISCGSMVLMSQWSTAPPTT